MSGVLAFSALGWDLSFEAGVIGITTGLTYAVLAAGLVLIYRATGILNFAQGEVGALAGAVLAYFVVQRGWSYWVTLLLVTALGLLVGALTDLLVIRRLSRTSKLTLLAATLGLAQVLLVLQITVPNVEQAGTFPSGSSASVTIGGITLFGEHLVVLAVVPALILALGAFLTRTRYGLAIRASADNRDAARLAGISPRRVSLVVWSVAGGLSAVTYVLNAPVRGTIAGVAAQGLGPSLLLRALAAALVGRFVSLPMTLVGGIAVGVIESQAFLNVTPGTVDALMFVLVAVLVLVRVRGSSTDDGDIGSTAGAPPLSSWVPPALGRAAVLALLAGAVLLPVVATNPSQHVLFSEVAIYAIVAISVVVVTGWSGQLSLCQFAFVGLGAVMTYALMSRGMAYGWACVYAIVAGVLAALAVGIPALRTRGFFLAVTTLGFAVAAKGWLLPHERFFGDTTVAFVPRGRLGPLDLSSQRTFYYLTLVVLLASVLIARHLRASGVGRSIVAVRENERSAEAMTISAVRMKLVAFGLSGALAATAGALFAGLQTQFQVTAFDPSESLRVVAMTIIGGVGSIAGALVGAVFVLGLPAVIGDTDIVRLLTGGIGLLAILLIEPGGLLELARKAAARVAHRRTIEVGEHAADTVEAVEAVEVAVPQPPGLSSQATRGEAAPASVPAGEPVLRAEGVTVRFGGLVAVDDVTIEVRQGEIVGLIGTNGAGKSTLLNAISGFVPTIDGSISFSGTSLDGLPPHARSRLGLARVFQDARLYPDLTVREAIAVALEATEPSELVPSALRLPPARVAEWRKARRADELLDELGLQTEAHRLIGELSTGSRRLVEIACLLAADAQMLLLDEPLAGVAHHETQRFVGVILGAKEALDATILIIEHDMSVIMSMSDRLYCMAAGTVIAEGSPDAVRNDPGVVAAYLGGGSASATPRHRTGRREPLVANR